MPIVGHDHEKPRRDWTLRIFVAYGVAGAAILLWQTMARWNETAAALARAGDAPLVILIFAALSLASAFLKFHITDQVFVDRIRGMERDQMAKMGRQVRYAVQRRDGQVRLLAIPL